MCLASSFNEAEELPDESAVPDASPVTTPTVDAPDTDFSNYFVDHDSVCDTNLLARV
jgi:hypothetical protein